MGESSPVKGQVLFLEADVNAALGKAEDQLAKIVQVASQPIHRVADHRVALTHVAAELLQAPAGGDPFPKPCPRTACRARQPSSWRSSFWSRELTRR